MQTENDKDFECSICYQMFTSKRNMKRHQLDLHNENELSNFHTLVIFATTKLPVQMICKTQVYCSQKGKEIRLFIMRGKVCIQSKTQTTH